jgi:uncharacterized membrane protein
VSSVPGERETGRVEAFSDGVFAIAMTLLVLDVKVPKPQDLGPGGLAAALRSQWPVFLAYLTSFTTILVMWVNHHILFGRIRRVTPVFLFLNGFLLLFVTFVPFPTALVAEYIERPDARLAAMTYSGTFVALAISFNALWHYAAWNKRLLDPRVDESSIAEITRQYSLGVPLYLAAFLLAPFSVRASLALCLLLAVFFGFTGSLAIFRRPARSRQGLG